MKQQASEDRESWEAEVRRLYEAAKVFAAHAGREEVQQDDVFLAQDVEDMVADARRSRCVTDPELLERALQSETVLLPPFDPP
ncbi:hypothetical protein DIPPA_31680 [Diplonema papillatum]|nr:hypothetical protein DIPPA_31680 [Diplonema papillatum]